MVDSDHRLIFSRDLPKILPYFIKVILKWLYVIFIFGLSGRVFIYKFILYKSNNYTVFIKIYMGSSELLKSIIYLRESKLGLTW